MNTQKSKQMGDDLSVNNGFKEHNEKKVFHVTITYENGEQEQLRWQTFKTFNQARHIGFDSAPISKIEFATTEVTD